MKVERRIVLSNVFNVALIALIGFFAIQNLDLILTKLRFVEIADDLNASFLEMRLSEKNYFLYRDDTALFDTRTKIDKTMETIGLARNDIIRAVGENNLKELESRLQRYSEAIEETRKDGPANAQMETRLRTEGKGLKEFSDTITRMERMRVNGIIASSKNILLYSFLAILIVAVVVSHFVSQKILRSLREIEKLTKSISEGNFDQIRGLETSDELGSVIRAINFMSEELRHREEQIIQSKKLSSIGVLTAGVAHELTNPLNNVSMIAQTYAEVYDKLSNEDRIGLMHKVDGEVERMKEIIRNLLDFSKPKEANLTEADINAVIQKTLKLMENMLGISNVETKLNLAEGLPGVFIDKSQIQQVLVNLIVNAVHSMPSGGTLFLASRPGRNGDSVEMTVMDTGKGIPPEFLPHIFDPFFSTKGVGGTGLGLSVSYGIIKNHKGNIRVESKVGVGTTFTIELPVHTQEEE
jgi:signal transduction histidine kinase